MRKGTLKVDCPFLYKDDNGHQQTEIKRAGTEVSIHAAGKSIVTACVEVGGEERMFFVRPDEVEIDVPIYTKDIVGFNHYKAMEDGRYLQVLQSGDTVIVAFSITPGDAEATEQEFNDTLSRAKDKINGLC